MADKDSFWRRLRWVHWTDIHYRSNFIGYVEINNVLNIQDSMTTLQVLFLKSKCQSDVQEKREKRSLMASPKSLMITGPIETHQKSPTVKARVYTSNFLLKQHRWAKNIEVDILAKEMNWKVCLVYQFGMQNLRRSHVRCSFSTVSHAAIKFTIKRWWLSFRGELS